MSLRKTLIFTVIFASLLALIYFIEIPRQKQEEEKNTSDKQIMKMDWDSVNRIELSNPRQKVLLEKADGQWMLKEPVDDLADKYQVTSIINALRFGNVENRLAQLEQPLADYGLDPPSSTITLRAGGVTRSIEIGKKYSLGSMLFIKLADSPKVLIVSYSLLKVAEKSVTQLRESKIFREEQASVTGLTIQNDKGLFKLVKAPKEKQENEGEFEWKFIHPSDMYANENAVDEFVNTTKNLTATDFVAENRSEDDMFGLDSPKLRLKLTFELEPEDNENNKENEQKPPQPITVSKTLIIGNQNQKDGNYFAALDDSKFVVTLPADSLNDLMVDPVSLRDRHLVRNLKAKTAKISLQTSGFLAIITHSGSDWTFEDGQKADLEKVNDLLNDLEKMQGTRLDEPIKANSNKWLIRLKLKRNGINDKSDWIELADKEGRPFSRLVKGAIDEKLGSVIVADMVQESPKTYKLAIEEVSFWPESMNTYRAKEAKAKAEKPVDAVKEAQ